jgi:hypothetical protein
VTVFGASVAIDGDTVVVGAPRDDHAVNGGDEEDEGSAYVFERDEGGLGAWGQVKKLTAGDAAALDEFGYSVAIDGDTVVVGARFDDHEVNGGTQNAKGSAYVFERNSGGPNGWGQVKKLTASDAFAVDLFGSSVAIDGDRLVVGASGDDHAGNGGAGSEKGSAYVFEWDAGGAGAWGKVAKLTASDAFLNDEFGTGVAVDSGTVGVGAPFTGQFAMPRRGSAYVYDILPEPEPDGLLFSLQNGSLAIPDAGTVRDEDIVLWDPEDGYSMFWDGSEHGLTANVDGFSALEDGSLLLSLASNASVAGVGPVSHADILRWHEEEHGLDEDLFLCRPVVPELEGGTICAAPALWDGSDAGLGAASEDVSGLTILGSTSYLTTSGNWTLGVLSGANEDVIACQIKCVPATVYFDGTDNGLPASATLDAIHVPAVE